MQKTIAKFIFNILTKHTYLPTTTISNKGSTFMSQVNEEVAGIFGVTLKHASNKARAHNWDA